MAAKNESKSIKGIVPVNGNHRIRAVNKKNSLARRRNFFKQIRVAPGDIITAVNPAPGGDTAPFVAEKIPAVFLKEFTPVIDFQPDLSPFPVAGNSQTLRGAIRKFIKKRGKVFHLCGAAAKVAAAKQQINIEFFNDRAKLIAKSLISGAVMEIGKEKNPFPRSAGSTGFETAPDSLDAVFISNDRSFTVSLETMPLSGITGSGDQRREIKF